MTTCFGFSYLIMPSSGQKSLKRNYTKYTNILIYLYILYIYMTFILIKFSCVWLVYLQYASTCGEYGNTVSDRRCSVYRMLMDIYKIGSVLKACMSGALGVVVQDCSPLRDILKLVCNILWAVARGRTRERLQKHTGVMKAHLQNTQQHNNTVLYSNMHGNSMSFYPYTQPEERMSCRNKTNN